MLPIHHAARGGNKETLQYLVDLGANINEKDWVGTNESKYHWTSNVLWTCCCLLLGTLLLF